MKKLAYFAFRRPVITLGAVALLTVAAAFGIPRIEIESDYNDALPFGDFIVDTRAAYESVFGQDDPVLIAVESDRLFSAEGLALVDAITREAKDLTGVRPEMVTSIANAVHVEAVGDEIRSDKLLKSVPEDAEAIAAIRAKALSDPLMRGFLVSEDGTTALIVAPVDRDTLPKTVYDETKEILDRHRTPGFRLYMYGNYIVGQAVEYGVQWDLILFLGIGYGLIFFGLFVSFFHWRGLLLPAAVMVTSVVWTMGLIGFMGQTMSTVSMLIPILLLAVGSSFSIHIVHRFDESLAEGREGALARAVDAIWVPIVLSGATTALGTFTLMVFKVSFIRDFGLWGSVGVLIATVLTLTVIPAGLALVADRATPPRGRVSEGLDGFLGEVARFTLRRKRWVYGATAALVALSILGVLRIQVGVDPVSFFPEDHELREVDALFNRRFNGANYLQVMIQGPTPGSVHEPEFVERVANLQKFAEGLGDVRSTFSLVDVLRRFQTVLLGADAPSLPETREAVAQYLLLYSLGRDTMEDLVDVEDRSVNVTLRIPHTDNQRHEEVFRAIDRHVRATFPPEYRVHYGGTLMLFVAMTHYVVVGKIVNIACSWLIIILFCGLIYRSISRGLITVVPPAFGTIFTFGMMGFLGIRLDPATAILTAIAVGIGVDFAIHMVARLLVELERDGEIEAAAVRTLQTAGRAVLLDVFSNVLGFSAVIFSRFIPIQNFGYLVVLAMVTTAFATLLLLVPLADSFRPKFLFAPAPRRAPAGEAGNEASERRAA